MNRIVHLVRADLRRLRLWGALWLVALSGPIAWAWFAAEDGGSARLEQLGRNVPLMVAGQLLLAYVLVLVLMHADPAIGTRQFWVTRPIAPGRMFVAKLAAALVLLWGGAVLVGLPWWLWNGAEPAQMLRMAAEFLGLALFVIVPAMLISALTDTLGRAVLWSFAQGAGILGLLLPLAVMWNPTRIGSDAVMERLAWTVAIWWSVGLAVTWRLFVTRRHGWQLVLVALGIVAVPFGINLAAPEGSGSKVAWQPMNPELGPELTVAFRQAWSSPVRTSGVAVTGVPQDQLRIGFALDPKPAGDRWLAGLAAEQQWQWPGLTLRRDHALLVFAARTMPGFRAPAEDPETVEHLRQERAQLRARLEARGRTLAEPVPANERDAIRVQSFGLEPSSLPARMAREASRYDGRLWLAWLRPTVVNQVPMRAGALSTAGGLRVRVTGLESIGERLAVRFVHSEPVLFVRRFVDDFDAQRQRRALERLDRMELLALHPARREQRAISLGRERGVAVHGVEISVRTAIITTGRVRRKGAWTEPEGWPEGAVLAHVMARPEAIFAREVTVPEFTLSRN